MAIWVVARNREDLGGFGVEESSMIFRTVMAGVLCAIAAAGADRLDARLREALAGAGFTGRVEATLEARLGRSVDPKLAELGRLLFFDVQGGLHGDNTCAGCHSPTSGFGDTQSIAIGVQNNGIVGPARTGPRNQRRTPTVINTAFFPRLMWNGRFSAPSGDAFNNSGGFLFPAPEGETMFPAGDPRFKHLLVAQAHIPPTELVEVAGFTGTSGTIGPRFDQFDDGLGTALPPADSAGFRNDGIRRVVLEKLNGTPEYRTRFGQVFPAVAAGAPIDFVMFGKAIAEFEFTLVFANAPIDRFARGEAGAMSNAAKRGALLFFGKAGCVSCHAVGGIGNEMFSDFENHVAGVPQVAPRFGVGKGNVIFDGPNEDEDFGLEQITGLEADRYKFRTAPLRNIGGAPAFFHNGAFTRLRDAIYYHVNTPELARRYNPNAAGLDSDLTHRLGPMAPVLERMDGRLKQPPFLTILEIEELVQFVGDGLMDPRASRKNLCGLIPERVPSGIPVLRFQGCPPGRN